VTEMIEADDAATSTSPARDEKKVLRESIERSEADLREAVDELTTAVKNDMTLAAQIAEHPTVWLAGGFVVGVLLAWRR